MPQFLRGWVFSCKPSGDLFICHTDHTVNNAIENNMLHYSTTTSGSLCVTQARLCVCGKSAFCVSERERERESGTVPGIVVISIWLASYANEYKELFLQPGGREISPDRLRVSNNLSSVR